MVIGVGYRDPLFILVHQAANIVTAQRQFCGRKFPFLLKSNLKEQLTSLNGKSHDVGVYRETRSSAHLPARSDRWQPKRSKLAGASTFDI